MKRRTVLQGAAGAALLNIVSTPSALAAAATEIDQKVDIAIASLLRDNPGARALAEKARGILVFPNVIKGGLIFGGQFGEGALRKDGVTADYYNTVAASWGLQAGIESFGYAMLFMTDAALAYLDDSDGFEIGVGPTIVVLDKGAAATITSSTLQNDIYAFIFDQSGLMAGIGIQGSKITRITPG